MDLGKQLLLTEPECLIACMNRHYGNPPLETSTLDCILANRPFPCSLCASRCQDTVLVPCSRVSLPPLKFRSPPASHAIAPVKKNKLTRKERDLAKKELIAYRDHLRVREQNRGKPPSLTLLTIERSGFSSRPPALDQLKLKWRHIPFRGDTTPRIRSRYTPPSKKSGRSSRKSAR
jgi:hypothetical protein